MNIPGATHFLLWAALTLLLLILFLGCTYREPIRHNTIYRGPYPVKHYEEREHRVLAAKRDKPEETFR